MANIDDAEPSIERAVRDGADYIKLFHDGAAAADIQGLVQPREEVQAAVVAAAHRKGLKVIAHALARQDTIEVLRAGVDGMAHSFYDKPIIPEIIEAYKTNNAWLNPTLAAVGSLTGRRMACSTRSPRTLALYRELLRTTCLFLANVCT